VATAVLSKHPAFLAVAVWLDVRVVKEAVGGTVWGFELPCGAASSEVVLVVVETLEGVGVVELSVCVALLHKLV